MTVPSYKPVQTRAKLALVIPALREAANLAPLLARVRRALQPIPIPWEVIVVDDNSRDGTEQIVSAIARNDSRVRLLVRRGQRGLSGAVLHGWRHTDATVLGAMDADGQHPPDLLPDLLAAILNGRDLAIASRYAPGARPQGSPIRRLLSLAAIRAARPLQTPPRITDPLSGFFLVRRPCIANIEFRPTGFKLLLEILVRGSIDAIQEVPFALGTRPAGRSKMSIIVVGDYLALLARLYRDRFTPAHLSQEASGD